MQICSGWNVNGAIITCLETTRALLERGHEITLVCRPNAWIGQQFPGGEVQVIHSDLSRWPLTELKRVAAIAREKKIDVVHTHMSRAHFFGVLLRHLFKIPCVATANNRYLQLHWMFNDRVIAASRANKKYHSRVNLVPK
ncbi:MAG: glycosyltransferase, partial [Planctomycetales bacterium]|nr:glycosyltransferase [Planctomycetales bacterium]